MLLNQTKNISRVFSTRLPEHFRGFKNFQSRIFPESNLPRKHPKTSEFGPNSKGVKRICKYRSKPA